MNSTETRFLVTDNPTNPFERATRLFQSHYGLVYGAARRFAPLSHCIDDIVQDTYITFVQGVMEDRWDLRAGRDVGPLLYQIAKRKAQKVWKEQKKRNHASLNAIAEQMIAVFDESEAGEELESLQRREMELAALHHCLGKLSPRHRALIELHYYEDVPVKEIAARHTRSGAAIYQLFARIRVRLRECIRNALKENDQ